jgi:predicted ATP-grasp superfamily ATP-dependent carboligase
MTSVANRNVLITDGDQRASLAVVRSLGRAGIPVTIGSSLPESLAGSSKYCAGSVQYPSPVDRTEDFLAFIEREMSSGRYRVLLPMSDITVRLVSRMRDSLSRFACVPFPFEQHVIAAQDKTSLLLLAKKLSIPVPETLFAISDEIGHESLRNLKYPVVIKPRFSRYQQDGKWISGDVQYAWDPEDLRRKYEATHSRVPCPLVQERIEGEGRGVFLLVWNGELKAAFCHRRLREKPPWGGPSVYRESIPFDEEMVGKSLRLLQAIGWQGPAMVEFKVDNRDGQSKLMEVNGRFWGSLQLAIDAGMNFPLLLFRLATGEDVPAQFDYKVGVKSRWLLGDLDHLLIRLTHHADRNGFGNDGISRLHACWNFMKFYEPNTFYEVFRWEDRGPGWQECKAYIRDLRRSAGKRKETARAH